MRKRIQMIFRGSQKIIIHDAEQPNLIAGIVDVQVRNIGFFDKNAHYYGI